MADTSCEANCELSRDANCDVNCEASFELTCANNRAVIRSAEAFS